ncbi:MAG: class I SAM-dependent methyltransferase [Myxococcales bacterium]
MGEHERALREAFDGQAERFERAPVQSDPAALARLVAFAALPPGSRVLDAGSGPGLVSEAFLAAGHEVQGIDLSSEMVRRARERCARFGERARFEEGSLFEFRQEPLFDAGISRFVLHHAADPVAFLRAQILRIRPGGVVVASDHTTDADPAAAGWHQEIERARDRTHVRNLGPGGIVDAMAAAGLVRVGFVEEEFELDFDEWFDRGTPALPKAQVREMVESGGARGFDPVLRTDGGITIRCVRALARGVRPG